MLNRISSYVFLGSLFGVVIIWGYLPRLWLMSWPQWALLGISAAALVLWVLFSLEGLRNWLKKRSTQFGISLAITAIMSLVILGSINWAASEYNRKWDVTVNKLHTLSDQSQKIARELKEKVNIRVWTTGIDHMSANLDMRKFLENYRIASNGKINIDIRNPNEDRTGAAQDNVKKDNLIVIKSESGRESRVDGFTDTKGEEQITNGIIQAVKGGKKTVCFLAGHGEASLSESSAEGLSFIKERLDESSYSAREVTLASSDKMPPDCEALVIVGPKGDVTEKEGKMVEDYLTAGGKILALLGPGTTQGWKKFAANFGVTVRTDLIIDPRVQPPIAIATKNYANDVDIVKSFNRLVVFPEVSSIGVPTSNSQNGANIRTFVSSESYTYAKSGDLKSIKSIQPSSSDMHGPLPVAVLIEKPITSANAAPLVAPPALPPGLKKPKVPPASGSTWTPLENEAQAQDEADMPPMPGSSAPPAKDGPKDAKNSMSLIVVGNSTFASNSFVSQMGNMDLFLNSINYLLKDQDLIGIRPREIRQASLEISEENFRQVWDTILLIAGFFLVGGIRAGRRKSLSA